MAIDVDIDVGLLKSEIKKTYVSVSDRPEQRHGFDQIETGQLVDTDARSKFEERRRKAKKFGARGITVKAYKRLP